MAILRPSGGDGFAGARTAGGISGAAGRNVRNKITLDQARAIARATVGRRPNNAPAPAKVLKINSGTGLSPRERTQVSIKQPVQKIVSSAGKKTPGQVAQAAFEKRSVAKAALAKSLTAKAAPKPVSRGTTGSGTSTSTRLGGTVSKPGANVRRPGAGVTAQDIKNVVQQRTARQAKGPVATNVTPPNAPQGIIRTREEQNLAARAAQRRVNAQRVLDAKQQAGAANQQYRQSQSSSYVLPKVANPMDEASANREIAARVAQANVEIRKAESLSKPGILGKNHAGGHSDVASNM